MTHSVEFKFLAPRNKAAKLIGSFSDWEEIALIKGDDGHFRTSVDLDDGIYQYKYRVQSHNEDQPDQWVEVNDPYATEIDEETRNGVIRIKNGQRIVDTYQWQYDDQPLPQNHELVIYELLISDFFHGESGRGQYRDVIEKLDYLQELGINAIELLPLNETPRDYNWGYLPSYYFAPKPDYGSTEDLKRLIDECHARGIRVILDQIFNHSSDESPLLQIDKNYWYYEGRHHPDADPSDYWGPEFNYEYCDETLSIRPAWKFMLDVLQHWIQEYHIDGIRFDALKELDNYDLLFKMTQEAKELAGLKPFYNIGEHIPEKPDIIQPDGPMDGCWHDNFYHQLIPHLKGGTFDLDQLKQALDPQQQGYPEGVEKAIAYLCNHDQTRLLLELGDQGILDDEAFRRAKLGAVLLMTSASVPLIWMGEEFGDSTDINADQENQQLNWSLLNNDRNSGLLKHYKGLIELRKQNPALQTSNLKVFHEDPDGNIFSYERWNEAGSRVFVVVNLSDQFIEGYQVSNIPENGTWHEWSSDYDVQAEDQQLTINIGEYEAQVFIWR